MYPTKGGNDTEEKILIIINFLEGMMMIEESQRALEAFRKRKISSIWWRGERFELKIDNYLPEEDEYRVMVVLFPKKSKRKKVSFRENIYYFYLIKENYIERELFFSLGMKNYIKNSSKEAEGKVVDELCSILREVSFPSSLLK